MYIGAVAIFGLFFIAAIFPLSSNPVFCGTACHSQNPEYFSWQKSAHAKVTCYACHINPSYAHLIVDKLTAGPLGIVHTLTDSFEKPINETSEYSQKHVPAERCLRCHSPATRNFTGTLGLNITSKMHIKHLDAGLECTTCHNRIAHLGAEKYEPLKSWKLGFKYKNFMTMRDGCWRCHSKDIKYRSSETLQVVQGNEPPTRCNLCHNREWNLKPTVGKYNHNDVNGVPWRDGKRRHGAVAKSDFSACLGCHQKAPDDQAGIVELNCTTTCHGGVTMPHNIPKWAKYFAGDKATPLWMRAHPFIADALGIKETADFGISDPQFVCSRCHNKDRQSANFCQSCHHQSFVSAGADPNVAWKPQHPSVVKQIGSSGCQRCHLLEFCAYCHTNGEKAARGMFLNRTQEPLPQNQ